MKYFELAPFDLRLNAETIITALHQRRRQTGRRGHPSGRSGRRQPMMAAHMAALTSERHRCGLPSAWASRSRSAGRSAVIVWSYFRLQAHRADAVAMAHYRKLAEEAVANQQELRDRAGQADRARAGGRAADAGRGMNTRLRLYRQPDRNQLAWRCQAAVARGLVPARLPGVGLAAVAAAVFAATLTAAVLCITLAGIPLLVAAAGVIRGCANAERWRLHEVLAEPVHGGYRAVTRPGILSQVRDPVDRPGHLARFRLPVRPVPAAVGAGLRGHRGVADAAGRYHAARLVLVPRPRRSITGSKRPASSSATSRTARTGPAGMACS